MTKTHETKKIIFCPKEIKIDYDGNQGIFFVNLETEPFDYEGEFVVKNPNTGKLEGKIEIRKFSHLKFTFNSQKEIDNFSAFVKTGQFYEVETNWSSNVKTGKVGSEETKEIIWVKENNPPIKKNDNLEKKLLLEFWRFFQNNDIKSIGFKEDKLCLTFNSGNTAWAEKSANLNNRQKLEQVKIYLKNNNKEVLAYSELSTVLGINSSHNSNKGNGTSGGIIVLIIVGVLSVVGFFSWLIWKGKRTDAPPTIYRTRNRWG